MRNALLATACVAVMLTGCSQSTDEAKTEATAAPAPPPAVPPDPSFTGLTRPKGDAQFGYYLPTTEVKVGSCAGPCSPTSLYSGAQCISRCVTSWSLDLGLTALSARAGETYSPSTLATKS